MIFSKKYVAKNADPEAAGAIRLSVLDPPCRCREPLWNESVRGRGEILLDLRDTHFQQQIAPVLRACNRLTPEQRLRVRARTISWPLMAALQATGYRYQIISSGGESVEFFVWPFLSREQRERYLRGTMQYTPVWPPVSSS